MFEKYIRDFPPEQKKIVYHVIHIYSKELADLYRDDKKLYIEVDYNYVLNLFENIYPNDLLKNTINELIEKNLIKMIDQKLIFYKFLQIQSGGATFTCTQRFYNYPNGVALCYTSLLPNILQKRPQNNDMAISWARASATEGTCVMGSYGPCNYNWITPETYNASEATVTPRTRKNRGYVTKPIVYKFRSHDGGCDTNEDNLNSDCFPKLYNITTGTSQTYSNTRTFTQECPFKGGSSNPANVLSESSGQCIPEITKDSTDTSFNPTVNKQNKTYTNAISVENNGTPFLSRNPNNYSEYIGMSFAEVIDFTLADDSSQTIRATTRADGTLGF